MTGVERAYLFRGDDRYVGGSIGLALGTDADAAEIQDFAEHVLRKESKRTSRFVSFTGEIKIARRFTSFEDSRNVRKVEMARLRKVESQGIVRIWEPDQVGEALKAGAKKKLAKQAGDIRAAMIRNCELLIEGQIPAEFVKQVE